MQSFSIFEFSLNLDFLLKQYWRQGPILQNWTILKPQQFGPWRVVLIQINSEICICKLIRNHYVSMQRNLPSTYASKTT